MAKSTLLTIKQAVDKLPIGEKTLRRYATKSNARHRIPYSTVEGKYGDELRFREEDVEALKKQMSNGAESDGQSIDQGVSKREEKGSSENALDVHEVWTAYQELQEKHSTLSAQLGFWQGENEKVKLLTGEAETLRSERDVLGQENDEQEIAITDAQAQEQQMKRALRTNQIAYFIMLAIIVITLIAISPLTGSLIIQLFRAGV